jgi:lipoprotein NlpI
MSKKVIWYHLVAITCLIAITFIVYRQVANFDFINIDDSVYVTNNSHVQNGLTGNSVEWALKTTYAGFWHPMTWLSLMLDSQMYGKWAGGYHLTSLLLHIANSLLLLLILFKMTGSFWRSGFVAALFALHPLHIESVAWIAERKDVLSTFFGMLTIYAYISYAQYQGVVRYLLVVVLFLFSLMAKPMLVTLPFALLLLDYWPLRRFYFNGKTIEENGSDKSIAFKTAPLKCLILEKIPLLVIIVPICIVTYYAENKFGALPSMESFPLDIRILNSIMSYVRYMDKMFLPINLSVYYPHSSGWPVWQVLLSGGFLILASILSLLKAYHHPYLTVGWFWYLGTLIPVIGIIQVGPQAMADRYTYIPLIGLFIIITWGVTELTRTWPYKKTILSCCSVFIIITLSILSWQRCQLWGDKVALWDDVIKKYKVSSQGNVKNDQMIAFAYNFRGLGYADKGQYKQAIDDYNTALATKPDYTEALNNRAIVYGATGEYQLAFRDLANIITINPGFADAYYNRGNINLAKNHLDLAINDFTAAINIEPDIADAFNNRGVAFLAKKEYQKAFIDFTQALKINRNHAHAYYNRGRIYNIYQQYDAAIEEFNQALKIKPDYADAANNLQITLNRDKKLND